MYSCSIAPDFAAEMFLCPPGYERGQGSGVPQVQTQAGLPTCSVCRVGSALHVDEYVAMLTSGPVAECGVNVFLTASTSVSPSMRINLFLGLTSQGIRWTDSSFDALRTR